MMKNEENIFFFSVTFFKFNFGHHSNNHIVFTTNSNLTFIYVSRIYHWMILPLVSFLVFFYEPYIYTPGL